MDTAATPVAPGHARRGQWFSLGAFTTIALVSIVNEMNGSLTDQRKQVKWSTSAIIVALVLAAMSILASFALRDKFNGTPMEHGIAVMVLGIWAAGLSTIMKPGHDIATDRLGGILNPNLYFFSWAAFAMSVMIYADYLKETFGIGKRSDSSSFNVSSWAGLAMTSFVVMSAATRLFKQRNCGDWETDFCDRTEFAVALGAVSGVASMIWMGLGSYSPAFLDIIMSFLALAFWCFGVAYITFGDNKAPADRLGNLYFFTWLSFGLASSLAASGMQTLIDVYLMTADAPVNDKENDDDTKTPAHDEAHDEEDQA